MTQAFNIIENYAKGKDVQARIANEKARPWFEEIECLVEMGVSPSAAIGIAFDATKEEMNLSDSELEIAAKTVKSRIDAGRF